MKYGATQTESLGPFVFMFQHLSRWSLTAVFSAARRQHHMWHLFFLLAQSRSRDHVHTAASARAPLPVRAELDESSRVVFQELRFVGPVPEHGTTVNWSCCHAVAATLPSASEVFHTGKNHEAHLGV